MRDRDFTLYGRTNQTGGMMFGNGRQMTEFLKQWPDQLFMMDMTIVEDDTSKALVAYYKRYIVPEFQRAFKKSGERLSVEQVDIRLRQLSSVMHECNKELKLEYTVTIDLAGNHRASEYVEDLIIIGAKDFGIEIKNPTSK